MRVLVLAAIVILVVAAGQRVASASCRFMPPTLSPRTGATLPTNPTLYLFVSPMLWSLGEPPITATLDGRAVDVDVEWVAQSGAWTTVRVDIAARAQGELEVVVLDHDGIVDEPYHYTISNDAPRDVATVVTTQVGEPGHVQWEARGVAITVDGPAAAYRLEWADDESAWLMPVESHAGWTGVSILNTDQVFVGRLPCRGDTVPPEAFVGGRAVRLVAVFPDRREAVLSLGTMQIDDQAIRAPDDFAAPLVAVPPAPPVVPLGDEWVSWLIFAGVGGLLAAGLGLGWAAWNRPRAPLGGDFVAP